MQEFTPEQRKHLGDFRAQMFLRTRYSPLPPGESKSMGMGNLDYEHRGSTIHGIDMWRPTQNRIFR